MDVIALHKSGFTNAVATLGTALTREHAALLSRYTSEVLLCYDSDGAGQKATNLALEIFKSVGMRVKVIKMPRANDPDEFIKAKGYEAFEKLIGKSQNAVLYKISKLMQEYDSGDVDEKIKLIDEMAKIFAGVPSQIEQDILIKETATRYGVSADAIYAQVRKNEASIKKKEKREFIQREQKNVFVKTRNMRQMNECEFVMLMAYDKVVFDNFKDRITSDFFKTEACRVFIKMLFEQKQNGINADPAVIITNMPAEFAPVMTAVVTEEKFYENPLKAAEDIYKKLTDSSGINIKDINDTDELQKVFERLKSEKH
jgi:DNA primase